MINPPVKDENLDWFYVSASWATGGVAVDSKRCIKWAPAVWWRFRGQPLSNLTRWLRKNGAPVKTKRISS